MSVFHVNYGITIDILRFVICLQGVTSMVDQSIVCDCGRLRRPLGYFFLLDSITTRARMSAASKFSAPTMSRAWSTQRYGTGTS